MSNLCAHHLLELEASAIGPNIIRGSFYSCSGADVLEWLTEHKAESFGGHSGQYVTGKVKSLFDRIWPVAADGGWRFQGLDPINGWQHMDWGCYKPDQPRCERKRIQGGHYVDTAKRIKYEHPEGAPTRAFFCDLDPTDPTVGRDYWENVQNDPSIPVVILEGAKKTAAIQSLGLAAVGLPGVAMWNQPGTQNLIPELELFATEGREVHICFDQDTKFKTRQAVTWEIIKLSSALRRAKCKIYVTQWNPALGKGVDDLIVNHGADAFHTAYAQSVRAEVFSVQRQSQLTFKPDWEAPASVQYLTDAGLVDAIPTDEKLVCIRAGKGTGKTEVISHIAERARGRDQRMLVIVHRVRLAEAIADRLDVLSIYEVVGEKGNERRNKLAEVSANGMTLCAHSCHPDSQAQFKAEDWQDDIVVIDEATQVLWDVLSTSILKGKRVSILKELQQLLAGVLSPTTAGRLLLLDADLDNIAVNGIRNMAGHPEIKPWVAISNYRQNTYQSLVHKKAEAWLLDAEDQLSQGKRLLVMTDTQQLNSKFSSSMLEKRWGKHFPDLRILRVDSDTLETKGHEAYGCIREANTVFANYDVVICSPSVETGVSLDLQGHFDKVYGHFSGILSENSARQSLARLREPVPRVIFAATMGNRSAMTAKGETFWKEIIEGQHQAAGAILKELAGASIDDLGVLLPSALEVWAKYAARDNSAKLVYRETIMAQLRAEGQTVTEAGEPDDVTTELIEQVRDEVREEKHENLLLAAQVICAAADIDDQTYEKRIESTAPKTTEQKTEVTRKQLVKRYGVEPTPDLIMLDDAGWGDKIRLHYYLTVGREFMKAREQEKIGELIEASEGRGLWLPDVTRNSRALKLAALEWLQVPELLAMADDVDTRINQTMPTVSDRLELAQTNAKAVKLALGITVTEKTKPMAFIRALLDKVGFTLEQKGKVGPRGEQVKNYQILPKDSRKFSGVDTEYSCSRFAIFEQWLEAEQVEPVKTVKTIEEKETQLTNSQNPVVLTRIYRSYIPEVSTTKTPTATTPDEQIDSGQKSTAEPPPVLSQIEQTCLSILQSCDHWGQYLSVATQMGSEALGRLWAMLTPPEQIRIASMESLPPVAETGTA